MGDAVKLSQRRTLRPPSNIAVGRKGRSFNTNDKNKIKSGSSSNVRTTPNSPVSAAANEGIPQTNFGALPSGTIGWRSKSMNVKHSATTRLIPPKTRTPTLQTFKPDRPLSSNAPSVTSQSSDSQSIVSSDKDNRKPAAMNGGTLHSQRNMKSTVDKSEVKTIQNGSLLRATNDRANKLSIMKHSANQRSISVVKSTSPNRIAGKLTSKNHTSQSTLQSTPNGRKPASVMSRLRKLGTTTSNTPTTSTKPRSTSASKTALNSVSSSSSNMKKRAESCPPTSRLGTMRPQSLQKAQAPSNGCNIEANKKPSGKTTTGKSNLKSPSSLKSVKTTIGKAFGGAKQNEKKKSPTTPTSLPGLFNKSSAKKAGISKSEIRPMVPMVTEENPKPPTIISADLPPSEELRNDEDSAPLSSGYKDTTEIYKAVEPVSIASPRAVKKAHKTATVAPFNRQPVPVEQSITNDSLECKDMRKSLRGLQLKKENVDFKEIEVDEKGISPTTPAEAREMAVKGIADLRHNLEETMCSLRNTQLRHRADDAFQRRISAQLDGVEFDQINEAPCSGSLYRSHHNILSGRTNVRSPASFNSASPKLHAGETLGDHTAYKFGPGRFSSLQRTRSTRYPRTAWREVTTGYVSEGDALAAPKVETNGYLSDGAILGDVINKKSQKWDNATESLEDASSISSSEISECIADVNTDDVSSNNNSPYHHVRQVPLDQGDNLSFKLRNLGKESPNSTMTIESSTKSLKLSKRKAFTKPPSGKLGLRTPGSSVVGSRLAGNESTIYSPTSLKSEQPSLASRGSLCYRSLPRPHKSRLYEEAKTYVINTTQPACKLSDPRNPTNFGSYNSKASPSLERFHVLGKNSADSIKVTATTAVRTEPCVTFPQSRTTATTTVYHKPSPTKVEFSTSVATLDASPMNRRGMSYYSSMGRPGKTARNISASPLSYMSLPRSRRTIVTSSTTSAASPASTVTTWSPKRMNANRAYSIAPPTSNPFMSLDILSTPSLYLDEKNPMNSKMTEDILRQAAGRGGGVSDWPLPTLHSSSNLHDPDMPTSTIHVQTRDNNSSSADSCLGSSININDKRNNQLNTRSCSVMSSTPSLYSLTEDSVVPMGTNLDSLKGDSTLRSTLHKKVKVVTAFEESLSSMNDRFKQLSVTAEEKDSELQELRATIENLRRNRSPDDWSNSSCALKKKASCGSLSSITSSVSVGSTEDGQKRRKKHWLKESLKTAFGKRKSRNNMTPNEPEENDKKSLRENKEDTDVVAKLKEELLMKERKLTDIRLEALTSQHQLHQMQDAMQKMRNEMETLRQENDRLNRLELSTTSMDVMTHKENDFCQETNHMMNGDVRMKVMVEFPQHVIHDDMDEQAQETRAVISVCYVSRSIGWEYLDEMIKNIFQTYCEEVDPNTGLHLSSDSVASYSVGEATRFIGEETPDLLPCGYIVGNVDTINVRLRDGNTGSVDSLALELLIDRDTIKRYTQLVLDHGRVMLCGPAGTGKSTLANRLAEHVVRMTPKRSGLGAIVKFDLKQGNEIEISEYLHQLSEDCSKPESCGRDIPVVLVLDGIHGSSLLQGAFTPLLTTAAHSQLPYLIGVAQQNCASELELHQEFRWILCSNHTPPVSQFLHRSLKRTLHSWQIDNSCNCDDVMYDVVDWLPRCWQNINKCIETYNSADVTLGPRLFTKCPMDVTSSKAWFTDLWNFSVIPYVISAVKQGSKKATTQWCDPAQWVKESWPWSESCDLLSIRSEDVAIDSKSCVDSAFPNVTSQSNDPLLNMLLKLQEVAATNYGSDGSHDDVNHDDAFERSLDQALGDLS